MANNVVAFRSHTPKEEHKVVPTLLRGTIYLDLLTSYDGNELYVRPAYELEDALSEDVINRFNETLKQFFPDIVDQLFELYKST